MERPTPSRRLESIDLLRGLVIVLMALDHARTFFSPYPYQPENLEQASAALFLTRWLTHLCAPVFVFLAGTSAWLWRDARGASRAELAGFLVTRGLWLILLEVTVINLSWLHFVYGGYVFIQVIWVLGCAMLFLAALLWLPRWAIAAVGLAMVLGHNLADGVRASELGGWALPWAVLHEQYWQPLGESFGLVVVYPLVPWLGVLALGYALGPVFRLPAGERRRQLTRLGLAVTAGFVVLRLVNLYGDPNPWEPSERGALITLLSFLNTTKYPASLLFLAMTLGPALWMLPRLEGLRDPLSRVLVTFGRVPLFFYLIHVPAIHLAAVVAWGLRFGGVGWWAQGPAAWPPGYEPRVALAWVVWLLATAALYPVCRWFAGVKRRRRSPLLSYL